MDKDFEKLLSEAKKIANKKILSEYATCRTCWKCITY